MNHISDYTPQNRTDYLLLVAAVAAVDGSLPQEERNLLDRWMDDFQLPPESRDMINAATKQEIPELGQIQLRLAGTDLNYSLMLDMMGMAMVDGVLMDKEVDLLAEVAENIKIDPIEFNILIEFVHSAHQASQLSNPEPLYEHNIDSAFHVLRDRKVCLFSHTLLCATSRDYDQKLKLRWGKFNSA